MRTQEMVAAPARRPKDRRAQIALAAAELFCERGYHGVGIDEIAEAVGITGPAVYRHFPTKYAMLAHATRDLADAILAATAPAPCGDPGERLDHLLAGLAALGVRRRRVGGLYQWDGRHLSPADRERLRADHATVVSRLAEPLAALRPDLTAAEGRLRSRAALSVLASLSTHRAPIAAARARELLHRAAWAVLTHDVDAALLPVAGSAPEPSHVDTRRGAILLAAVRLFHEQGYHTVSVEDIGRAVGLSASSLYRHFPGKAELLAAVYHRAVLHVGKMTTAALARAASPAQALDQLLVSYVDLAFGHGELLSVYLAENTSLPPADRHELRRAQRLWVEEWVGVLVAVRPELATSQARVLVHAALNVIADLSRRARFDRRDGQDRSAAALALAALRG